MGDLTHSLFRRPCPLDDGTGEDDEWLGKGGKITVLEIGGQRTSDTYRISNSEELRQYVDLQHQSEDEDSCWQELLTLSPRSLKLFFLMSRADGERSNPSTMAKSLSAVIEALHMRPGSFTAYDAHDSEDDQLPPSSSTQRASLVAHSRNPRFPLGPIAELPENQFMRGRARSSKGEISRSWTWELRHIRTTTFTVADSSSTTYFCLDFPAKLQQRVSKTMQSLQALARNPLFMDTLMIDEIVNFYRDSIKAHRSKMLALKDDDANCTEVSIKLEELAAHWRTILGDIHSLQTHIHHLEEVAESRTAQPRACRDPSPQKSSVVQGHTRQQSSEVLGPPSAELFKLQHSTCEFWARCTNLYLERTLDRIRNSTYRLKKTIPLRRRGSFPQLNRRLSNLTIEIAVQFQRNGSSVSTLALSFLSTIFFSPDGLVLAITHWWWIFITLVIPLTFILVHLWFETLTDNTTLLRQRKATQQQHQQQLEELEEEQMD